MTATTSKTKLNKSIDKLSHSTGKEKINQTDIQVKVFCANDVHLDRCFKCHLACEKVHTRVVFKRQK